MPTSPRTLRACGPRFARAERALDIGNPRSAADTAAARGIYRLLLHVLAAHPDELESFYADTVSPLATHDKQHSSDLVMTLEAYLRSACSLGAADLLGVHRHTVRYRLDRVRELTGLDPSGSEGRERLGLRLKAGRLLALRRRGDETARVSSATRTSAAVTG